MTQIEIEQKLWADQYHWGMALSEDRTIACEMADAAIEQFRQRYPVEPEPPEPTAPEPTWYDEPPFPKDGATHPCWIAGSGRLYPALVYWGGRNWRVCFLRDQSAVDLAGRRVCLIHKPQEPTT